MFKITIPSIELFDEDTNTFLPSKETVLHLEHSLVSLSKWESKWCKPFLTKEPKTYKETIDYIECMTITQNVEHSVYMALDSHPEIVEEVSKYIDAPMTATKVPKGNGTPNKDVITAELIYYWMISLNIPLDCQKWHLNRLLTLINVCNYKNSPPTKRSRKEVASRYAALNAARRKALNSNG